MEIKEIFAKNLIELRKHYKMTQLELAEKLNYSDKAVSKWERAESLPDVETIKRISDLFGVTIDCLLRHQNNIKRKIRKKGMIPGQKILICLLSCVAVWVAATIAYVVCSWAGVPSSAASYCFILALPVTCIVVLVFNSVWGKMWINLLVISALIWTVALCVYIPLTISAKWLCFILPIPLEVGFIFFYGLKILNLQVKKREKEKESVDGKADIIDL